VQHCKPRLETCALTYLIPTALLSILVAVKSTARQCEFLGTSVFEVTELLAGLAIHKTVLESMFAVATAGLFLSWSSRAQELRGHPLFLLQKKSLYLRD
jgi:hypothetical protein